MTEDFRNRFKPWAYAWQLTLGWVAYAVLLVLSITLLQKHLVQQPWLLPVALLPMLPGPFIAYTILRFYARLDELERRIQGEAFIAASILTGFGTATLGFASNAGVAEPSLIWVFPAMIGLWGILGWVLRLRYR